LTILSLIAISAGLESASAQEPNREKPNILVIFIDDMGFADPSCFGNPLINAPNHFSGIIESLTFKYPNGT
jgi:hypothetical protein